MDHIVLGCVFSREVWALCLRWLRLDDLLQVYEDNTMLWWSTVRKLLPKALRQGFDSVFLLIGWHLWKERNARTFDRVASTAVQLVRKIEDEAAL